MPKNAGEAGKIKTSRDGARDPPYADDTDVFLSLSAPIRAAL
jgi:hypothetical protein